jgi:hypothetical protein
MVQAVYAPASLFAESLDGIQAVQGSKLRSLLLRSLQVFGEPGLLPGQVSQLGLHYLLLLATEGICVSKASILAWILYGSRRPLTLPTAPGHNRRVSIGERHLPVVAVRIQ